MSQLFDKVFNCLIYLKKKHYIRKVEDTPVEK